MMKASVMKKSNRMASLVLLALFFASSAFVACGSSISGSGIIASEIRDTPSFSSVSVGSAIKLVISQGSPYEVLVTADDNLLPYICTEVSGNTLKIGVEPMTSLRNHKDIVVHVTAPIFEKISCSGAAEVEAPNLLTQESLVIKCSGAGNVKLEVEAASLEVDASGASDVRLEGNTRFLKAELSGASDLKSYGLYCELAEVGLSGASDMQITVSGQVTGKASGASSLKVAGGASLNVNTSGASSVSSR